MEGGGNTSDSPQHVTDDQQHDNNSGGGSADGNGDSSEKPIANFRTEIEEYKIASAEARYRDRMLFTSFYLSLVALAVLLQIVLNLFNNNQHFAVVVVSLVSAVGFTNLLWWSSATKRARNKAWGRRKELEQGDKVEGKSELNEFKINEYLANNKSYDFTDSSLKHSNSIIGRSSSDLVIGFALIATLGWIGTIGGTTLMYFNGGSWTTIHYTITGFLTAATAAAYFFVVDKFCNSSLVGE